MRVVKNVRIPVGMHHSMVLWAYAPDTVTVIGFSTGVTDLCVFDALNYDMWIAGRPYVLRAASARGAQHLVSFQVMDSDLHPHATQKPARFYITAHNQHPSSHASFTYAIGSNV